jgi:hypothetical protein
MATRAIIHMDDKTIGIYKHWDGYPEATLPWLEEFHEDFLKNQGWDPEYELAQLLRSTVRFQKKYGLDNDLYTGWGITTLEDASWIDYVYTLQKDGLILINGAPSEEYFEN